MGFLVSWKVDTSEKEECGFIMTLTNGNPLSLSHEIFIMLENNLYIKGKISINGLALTNTVLISNNNHEYCTIINNIKKDRNEINIKITKLNKSINIYIYKLQNPLIIPKMINTYNKKINKLNTKIRNLKSLLYSKKISFEFKESTKKIILNIKPDKLYLYNNNYLFFTEQILTLSYHIIPTSYTKKIIYNQDKEKMYTEESNTSFKEPLVNIYGSYIKTHVTLLIIQSGILKYVILKKKNGRIMINDLYYIYDINEELNTVELYKTIVVTNMYDSMENARINKYHDNSNRIDDIKAIESNIFDIIKEITDDTDDTDDTDVSKNSCKFKIIEAFVLTMQNHNKIVHSEVKYKYEETTNTDKWILPTDYFKKFNTSDLFIRVIFENPTIITSTSVTEENSYLKKITI